MMSDPGGMMDADLARACSLAGVLAERGVSTLVFRTAPAPIEIRARDADLPRAIVELREGEAISSEGPPRFRVWREAGALRIESDDEELRGAFGA